MFIKSIGLIIISPIILLCVNSLQVYHSEIIVNKNSIDTLINEKFINHIHSESYKNLVIEKDKNTKEIVISYSHKQFGYNYNGTYTLSIESPILANIQYKNNFVDNHMTIEKINNDKIKIDICLFTNLSIPPTFLKYIIKKKLSYLREN
jgi:hypothetical protein